MGCQARKRFLTPFLPHFLLRYALGLQVDSGRVAHHIIPLEARTKFPELMRRAAQGGFDINGCNNGFAMLAELHRDNPGHSSYSESAFSALQRLTKSADYGNMTDADIAARLGQMANSVRERLTIFERRRIPLQ
jgi:hypothetical protein